MQQRLMLGRGAMRHRLMALASAAVHSNKKTASSCSRVGDFSLINLISCFLLLLSLWACGQRSCVVHMSTAMLRFALLSLRAGGALRTFGRRNQGKFGMLSYL
jgi:hypothetical protein